MLPAKTAYSLFFLLLFNYTIGQSRSIRGTIKDTSKTSGISNGVIYLLSSSDSGIYKFIRPASDGSFNITGIDTGKFIFLVSAYGYEDITKILNVNPASEKSLDLGNINLLPKIKTLDAVTIRKKVSIVRMNGDTTEFYVDSLKLQPNASAEDLLKHLPGLEVDKNGTITAQGEVVSKVLVDGNEFFGDDPTLATRNLYATMIQKVQLYDAKSKQAAFSGVDDGVKKTTLNLQLKKDSKNGYFGKVEAGYGSDKYYQGQAMFNDFREKRKFAVYGIVGNNNIVGLNEEDQDNYTGSSNLPANDELDSWNGRYEGQGIPVVQTSGVHYNDSWDKDRQSVNGNIKVTNTNIKGDINSVFIQNLPSGIIYSSSAQQFNNKGLKDQAVAKYEFQMSPSSSLELTLNESTRHKDMQSNYKSQSLRQDSSLLNTGMRQLNSSGNNNAFNSHAVWMKKLGIPGRTISIDANMNSYQSNYSGLLLSQNAFYGMTSVIDSTLSINQAKNTQNRSFVLDEKTIYTEPLWAGAIMSVNHTLRIDNTDAIRLAFNQSAPGKYDLQDSLYSNIYHIEQIEQRGGVSLNYKFRKAVVEGGLDLGATKLRQNNTYAKTTLERSFANWRPMARIRYEFSKQETISLNYSGSTNVPSAQQLNPIYINDDPLNIIIGNAQLTPSFSNNFNLIFRKFNMLANTTFISNSSWSFTSNPIVSYIQTDSSGRNTSGYLNASKDQASNFSTYFLYSKRFTEQNLSISLDGGMNQSSQISYSNGVKNITTASRYNMGLGMSRFIENKYDISLNVRPGYTTNNFTLQPGNSVHYWSVTARFNLDIYFLKTSQVHIESDYNYQDKFNSYNTSLNQFLCNAWLGRRMLPKENLLIKIGVNDLFNQNIGFNRSAYNNIWSQSNYSTIQRYFMLSIVWSFIKTNKAKS